MKKIRKETTAVKRCIVFLYLSFPIVLVKSVNYLPVGSEMEMTNFTCHPGGFNHSDAGVNATACDTTIPPKISCNENSTIQNGSEQDDHKIIVTSTSRLPITALFSTSTLPQLSLTHASLLLAAYFCPTSLFHGVVPVVGLAAVNVTGHAEKVGFIQQYLQNKRMKAGDCGGVLPTIGRCSSGDAATRGCAKMAGLRNVDHPKKGSCVKPVVKGTKFWCQIRDGEKRKAFDKCCSNKEDGIAVWTCSWAVVVKP